MGPSVLLVSTATRWYGTARIPAPPCPCRIRCLAVDPSQLARREEPLYCEDPLSARRGHAEAMGRGVHDDGGDDVAPNRHSMRRHGVSPPVVAGPIERARSGGTGAADATRPSIARRPAVLRGEHGQDAASCARRVTRRSRADFRVGRRDGGRRALRSAPRLPRSS